MAAKRKRAPKLPKATVAKALKTIAGQQKISNFEGKHPRNSNGKFKNK